MLLNKDLPKGAVSDKILKDRTYETDIALNAMNI